MPSTDGPNFIVIANFRCGGGAAAQNLARNAFLHSREKSAPLNPGIKRSFQSAIIRLIVTRPLTNQRLILDQLCYSSRLKICRSPNRARVVPVGSRHAGKHFSQ